MDSRNRGGAEEILAIFRSGKAAGEPLTASEVADRIDSSPRAARDRLDGLVEEGVLESKSVGADRRVWWVNGTDATSDSGSIVEQHIVGEVADSGEVGVLVIDAESRVSWLNEWTERYFGVDRSDVVGRDRPEVVREVLADRTENPEQFTDELLASNGDDRDVREFECVVTANDERRWLRHYSKPVETGRYAGGRVEFYYDVTPEKRREANRVEQVEQFQSLVQATEEYAIFLLDEDGTIESWNPGAERIKGYERSDIVGEHFSTFYTDDDVEAGVPEENLRLAREHGSVEDEGWRVRADGSTFWANVTITALTDDGEVRGFAKVTRDMTDRREREQRLQTERNLLEKIFDAAPSTIAVVSPDGTVVRANERADELLRTDELDRGVYAVGARDIYDANGEFVPVDERPYVRVFETGEPVRDWHCQLELPDDGRRWLSVNAVPLMDDDGTVDQVVVCGDDITQLKEQAERLERQRDDLESELDDVFERVSKGFFALDENWRFTYVNDRAEEYLERDESELLGAQIWEEFDDIVGTTFEEKFREAMETQEPTHFEAYHEPLETWFEEDVYPSASGLSVYFGDATERKERERELERYQRIVDNLPVGVYRNTPGPDGEFVEMNGELASIFDADGVDELMDYSVSDLYVDPDERQEFSNRLQEQGKVEDFELLQETLDGERIWISVTAIRTEEDGDVYFDGIVQDVTERKERERELKQYETLFEESKDVNAVIQPDGTYSHLTPSTEAVLGYDPAELVGENAFEYVHPDDRERIWEEFARVVEDPEYGPKVELRFQRADGSWAVLEAHARNLLGDPQINGIVAYTRDVTERKERERKLEKAERRYRALAENFPDGAVGVYDEDLRYTLAEGTVLGETLPPKDELEGNRMPDLFPDETVADLEPLFRGAVEDGRTETTKTEFGGRVWRVWATPLHIGDGEIFAGLSFAIDVTEQVEREQDLEEYETIVETVQDGVYVLDDDQRFVDVNEAYVEMTGYSREELIGSHASIVIDDETATEADERFDQIRSGERSSATIEADIERADGTLVRAESNISAISGRDGEPPRKVGVVRDLTERIERERELEARLDQQDVIADLGRRALENPELDDLFDEATELVADTLDNEYCKVLDLDRDAEELLLRSGVGWKEGYVGEATVGTERDSQAGYTLLVDEPVVVEDMEAETRFDGPDLLLDHGVESGVSVVIGSPAEPWGILGTHDTERQEFSDHDALFVQAVANILATAIDRRRSEAELENQREHLAALNNLHSVVRDVNDALVAQSTREEIERTVCERLADSDSYRFAWIGDVDARTKSVESRAQAGVEDYLETVEMSVDPDEPEGQGPTGRAARTREIQVTNDALVDPAYEPWRETAREYGFRSSAAIPIVYQDTLYGVLGVYSERVNAFEQEEREVIAQLGEIIGHAIAAVDRKQALMSDEVVELEIRMENLSDEVGHPEPIDGRISFEETVSVGDDAYLQYGTATDEAFETVESLTETLSHWEEVTTVGEGSERTRFELRLSEPPVISMVADTGGYIDDSVVENDTMHMCIHLPTTVDVRRVVDGIRDAYSTAEMVTRQQVNRADARDRLEDQLTDELTDRQRAALEASYHAGFFEWPRESSGEDIADSLGVSSPTFHQHLRKAQQKLFDSLLA